MATDLAKLPARASDGAFHCVVESPRGSTLKLKWDPKLGAMTLSRPLARGLAYPCDWGFVPSTRGPDGDPVDAVISWDHATPPGIVVKCRVVAVLHLEQDSGTRGRRERNDRFVFVPVRDETQQHVRDLADLPARVRDELAQFFVVSGALDRKNATVLGWGDADEATRLLDAAAGP